ncbi:hypothetical protein HC864_05830 [Candidatus Gracilibacteria bacterium]|nr:hypothetical protein [Thermales bacterium]NJL97286.1 hypothetical protein [Candidatus Gracilibacteria bacterium]
MIIFNITLIVNILYCFSKFLTKPKKLSKKNKGIKNNCPSVILISIAFAVTGNFSFFIFNGIANWLEKII